MRYIVTARVKPGKEAALLHTIDTGTLGTGSVAGDEYLRNMEEARLCGNGQAKWVEVCFCATPLEEELPYWQEYFDIVQIKDAHPRNRCRDETGAEPWACSDCDCTAKLEANLKTKGEEFLEALRQTVGENP
jgi:hypothetical protein